MRSDHMQMHFQTIYKQREAFFAENRNIQDTFWERPVSDKWSFGETYYHLYLMIKRFRQLNRIYLPAAVKLARMKKRRSFSVFSKDIYQEYKQKHHRPMKAPFLIVPPKEIQNRLSSNQLQSNITKETERLRDMLASIEDNIAGHIRYPDPIAHNPNLIQCIHILAIHEMHHFKISEAYLKL
ncbi:DinB superfamily protein [Terribacillus halophilus]|uniref:DinB superfamily protein n=1 Tax=Terribacillus halophilus TaxID=361279 RepID=A0A1G6VCF2_9BACI|nr:DinB family protein [Terribacillus halophilus]SDD51282.1 DinB superfamily protein [Terribacillus halophilus]